MTDSVKKAIEKYIDMMSQNMGVKIKFEEDNGYYKLLFEVDYGRYDKNSEKYDETYYNKIYPKSLSTFFNDRREKVQNFTSDMIKLFKLKDKITTGFSFYNYGHLSKVIKKIKNAIDKSEYPQIDVSFSAEHDNPTLYLNFKNTPFPNREKFKMFLEKLNDNVDYDLGAYGWSYQK